MKTTQCFPSVPGNSLQDLSSLSGSSTSILHMQEYRLKNPDLSMSFPQPQIVVVVYTLIYDQSTAATSVNQSSAGFSFLLADEDNNQ